MTYSNYFDTIVPRTLFSIKGVEMKLRPGMVMAITSVIDIFMGWLLLTTRWIPISWAMLGIAILLIGILTLILGFAVKNPFARRVTTWVIAPVSFILVLGSLATIAFYKVYFAIGPFLFLVTFYLVIPVAIMAAIAFAVRRAKKSRSQGNA